ncbi:leucine-rich repeat receptor-like serine/threonine/tyrosine-protein kinase SOBIR1 [Setaria viridis]|uniref:Protein kinase domain-containing protein n=1 Tax=Setaria viridis TaxID=4556 RepID=A0A4U6WB24_SETVI|nr:leucine-rich repeat receptor-like serine/threonine/tyrosine-protein kinase SOBIR1 [Setaria viridis]TKW39908.1 hypothetical protein SEVIR_1G210700v2 [Setaria viridis]
MASAASTPGKSLLVLASVVTVLLVLISAVESYDGGHAVTHSAVARRSRLGTRHARHRRTMTPHRYVLAEKSNTTGGSKSNTTGGSKTTSPMPAPLAEPSKHHRSHHKHRVRNWIVGFVVGSLAVVVSGLVLFRLGMNCIRGQCMARPRMTIFTPKLIRHADHLAFLEEEDGVASLEMIGRGGCGEVFRAQLPVEREWEEPRFIAIKKIEKHSGGDAPNDLSGVESRQLRRWSRQVQSEIRTVGHIRHRNLLPLAAHVPRPDCHYLVYEYMKRGSLHDALKAGGIAGLPWPARIHVALGIATGLEYLHFSHRPQILHRDLKPANILLDDDLEPRIADFGLAKLMPDAHTHVTASNLAGTWGYIAPEYHQTLRFTAKCDVYSFGVILAELATGKPPSDQFFIQMDEVVGLVKWLRRVMMAEEHEQAIDPAIAGAGHDEQIVLALRIAVLCTADDPKERPSAKDVRCMLSQIKIKELVKISSPKSS